MPLELYDFSSRPGVRRDGTELDSPYYTDGVWVRWQRGLPRKMGGYKAMSQSAYGPVRSVLVDSRNGVNSAHYFSQWGVQKQEFSNSGAGGSVEDRTPAGFVRDPLFNWSHDILPATTGGSYSALLACATPDVLDISSNGLGNIYSGDMLGSAPLTIVEDGSGPVQTSGGVCVLQPFLFVYGSDGLIRNSNANDFSAASGWTTGGSNAANIRNVAGTKFVYGAPVRGGSASPAGLFWALDSLVRVSFVQGTALWSYDTLTKPTSLLSKKAIIEHDGKFFWPGTDRFLFYNGVVQELPNEMNLNWFYDGLNMAQRNKVWGTKVPRWGELWWFYPRGDSVECDYAVIYNYRENTWYDARLERSAGGCVQVFSFPVWTGGEDSRETERLTVGLALSSATLTPDGGVVVTFDNTDGVDPGMFVEGVSSLPAGTSVVSTTATTVTLTDSPTEDVPADSVFTFTTMSPVFPTGAQVTGGTSGAVGTAVRVTFTALNLTNVTGAFVPGETLTGGSGSATLLSEVESQELNTVYQQEVGRDKVLGQDVSALPSSFTSRNFGFAVGSPFEDVPKSVDIMTRIERVEPDLNQVGRMNVKVLGRSFAQDVNKVLANSDFEPSEGYVDGVRAQERILALKFESNVANGHYQQGKILLTLGPGDTRSDKVTG